MREVERFRRRLAVGAVVFKIVTALSVGGLVFVPSAHRAPESVPPVTLVECWEDLSCSDGSTLDSWDCVRSTFTDDRGRLVHSNGQCGNPPGGVFNYWESVKPLPDGTVPTYQDWLNGIGR